MARFMPDRSLVLSALVACLFGAAGAFAADAVLREQVDRDRLVVHRLDVVDANGVPRLILAAPTPDPVIGGKPQPRRYPVSGLALFDEHGDERGGLGVADIPGGAPVLALDHDNFDAIGWKVLPDGSVSFGINDRRSDIHNPADRPAERIRLTVAGDGSPAIVLADRQDRPRLRLGLAADGSGVLQFLDARGRVVRSLSPEAAR